MGYIFVVVVCQVVLNYILRIVDVMLWRLCTLFPSFEECWCFCLSRELTRLAWSFQTLWIEVRTSVSPCKPSWSTCGSEVNQRQAGCSCAEFGDSSLALSLQHSPIPWQPSAAAWASFFGFLLARKQNFCQSFSCLCHTLRSFSLPSGQRPKNRAGEVIAMLTTSLQFDSLHSKLAFLYSLEYSDFSRIYRFYLVQCWLLEVESPNLCF